MIDFIPYFIVSFISYWAGYICHGSIKHKKGLDVCKGCEGNRAKKECDRCRDVLFEALYASHLKRMDDEIKRGTISYET